MNRQYINTNKGLIVTALSILLSVILFLIYGADLMFDEFEHLRAGYLVSIGFHPYKDFFEHHHPLLWYLWAPLLKYLPHNQILLFYLSRALTTLFSLIGVYYIYQTANRFFGGKKIAIYTLVVYFSFYFAQTMAVVFKPDAFMWCFYLCGLYYFFCFIATKELKHLCIASSAFTVSFLWLQTAVFLILPIVLSAFYLLYKDKKLFKKYLYASIPAIIILSIFLTFIHLTSGIMPYIQRNWILNANLSNFVRYPDLFLPKFLIFILIGYIAYAYQIKKHQATIYTHIIALCFTFSFVKNVIYLSSPPRYFLSEALAIAFLLAPIIPQLPNIAKNYLMAALVVFNIFNIATSLLFLPNKPYLEQIKLFTKNENTLVYPPLFNIYTPHFPFYWFFTALETGDNLLFRDHSTFDSTKHIHNHKILYIVISTDTSTKPVSTQSNDKSYEIANQKNSINSEMLINDYELIRNNPLIIYKRKSDL